MTVMNSKVVEKFLLGVREILSAKEKHGDIEGYTSTLSIREIIRASLINGERFSKAPLQVNQPFEISVSLLLSDARSVGFTIECTSLSLFARQLDFVLSQAVVLEHRFKLTKQSGYPVLKLATDEMLSLFDSGRVSEHILQVLERLDHHASAVKHSRLMGREVSASFTRGTRIYFDSVGNTATEETASCAMSCCFTLEDTTEAYEDVFGHMPNEIELKNIVELAAKNLSLSEVKPLGSDAGLPVLLTHKAVLDLLDQLVVPNLETRCIIDKTGAWELDQIGNVVIAGLTVVDQPHEEGSPFSAVFDSEGTPTKSVKIVDGGRLVHPLMTSALLEEVLSVRPDWQGRFELTGHAVGQNQTSFTNVHYTLECLPMGDLSTDSYIQIQNLTGMSVDPLTGQFALDADGAKVFESGRLKYSTSLTLRGNFFDALVHDSTRVGLSERYFNQWAPSIYTAALNCVSKELAQSFEDSIK